MIRKMGNFEVNQRTKDGFFNATALLEQWNKSNPKEKRALDNFWKSTNLDKLMLEIVINEPYLLEKSSSVNSTYDKNAFENQQVLNTQNSGCLKNINLDFDSLKKIVAKTSKANRGINKGTWLHPVMFVKFAMYLSPRFEYHVLRFVSDEMIKYRNLAGDSYKTLASHVATIVPKPLMPMAMKKIAQGLNFIVFGDHKHAMRNEVGEETKQLELFQLQQKVADLIGDEFIKSVDELITYLRKLYGRKYTPKALIN